MTPDEYAEWLFDSASSTDEAGVKVSRIPLQTIIYMGGGKVAYVERLMFHWTLKTAVVGDKAGYCGRWCYEGTSPKRVLQALVEWQGRGFQGEPTGWRREPHTGRRRDDDGDPATEYIDP